MHIVLVGYNSIIDGKISSGRERLLVKMAHLLYKSGHDISVVIRNKKGQCENYIKNVNYFFVYITYILKVLGKIFKMPYYKIRYFDEVLFDYLLSNKITSKVDILITTNAWIPITAKKAKKNGVRIILIAGNPSDNLIFKIITFEKKKFNFLFNKDPFDFAPRLVKYNKFAVNVDEVLTINLFTKSTYENDKNFSNSTIKCYPMIQYVDKSVVSENLFIKGNQKELTIFFLAHNTILKGLYYLLDSYFKLKMSNKKLNLIIGGGFEKSYKEFLYTTYGNLNNDIKFVGKVNKKEVKEYMISCDLFVCPSLIDMGPVTVFEAMINHKPVLLSSNCGNKWVIDNYVNGFIVKPYCSEDIIRVLEWCMDNRVKLNDMGENAYMKIKSIMINNNFQIEQIINDLKN